MCSLAVQDLKSRLPTSCRQMSDTSMLAGGMACSVLQCPKPRLPGHQLTGRHPSPFAGAGVAGPTAAADTAKLHETCPSRPQAPCSVGIYRRTNPSTKKKGGGGGKGGGKGGGGTMFGEHLTHSPAKKKEEETTPLSPFRPNRPLFFCGRRTWGYLKSKLGTTTGTMVSGRAVTGLFSLEISMDPPKAKAIVFREGPFSGHLCSGEYIRGWVDSITK